MLENDAISVAKLEILAEGFENSQRKVQLVKVVEAYGLFKELIIYHGTVQLIQLIEQRNILSWQKLLQSLPVAPTRNQWKNIGGQLMPEAAVSSLIQNICSGKINSWDEIHEFYYKKSSLYHTEKSRHAFASLLEVLKLSPTKFTKKIFISLLQQAVVTREWMVKGIYESRAKDYSNPFRRMVYETEKEMEKVLGKLEDNSFINTQKEDALKFRSRSENIVQQFTKK